MHLFNRTKLQVIALTMLVHGCSGNDISEQCILKNIPSSFEENYYIAHASGSPNGQKQNETYTNSIEGFKMSYANGFRIFEFDLVTLSDETIIAAHPGLEEKYEINKLFKTATVADIINKSWQGKYKILYLEDIVELLRTHPDIWIVTDTKWNDTYIATKIINIAEGDATILNRIVPHITSQQHLDELNAIYHFPHKILALYRWKLKDSELIYTLRDNAINNVAIEYEYRWNKSLNYFLEKEGVKVWVHTPRRYNEIAFFTKQNIGVYSDGLRIDCVGNISRPMLHPNTKADHNGN